MAHRDLKPENLLLDRDLSLKIADFGLSAIQENRGKEVLHTPQASFYTTCGSPNYASPEVIVVQEKGYNPYMADVWSCGVILFVLLTGYMPFDDETLPDLFRKIMNASFEIPDWISDSAKALIKGILTPDVNSRLTIADIRKSKWFNEGQPDNKKRRHLVSSSLAPVLGTDLFERELSKSAFLENFVDANRSSRIHTRSGTNLNLSPTSTITRDYTTGSFISVDGKEDDYDDDDDDEIGDKPISMTVFDVVAMVAGASLSRMFHGVPTDPHSGASGPAIRAYTQFSTNVPATEALLELADALSEMKVKHQVVNGKFMIKAAIKRALLNRLLKQHNDDMSKKQRETQSDAEANTDDIVPNFKPRKFTDKEIRISLQIFALANTTIVACHRQKGTTAAYYAFWKFLKKVLKDRNNLFASGSPRAAKVGSHNSFGTASSSGKKHMKPGRYSRMNSREFAEEGHAAETNVQGDASNSSIKVDKVNATLPGRAQTLLSEEEHRDPVRSSVFAPPRGGPSVPEGKTRP